MSQVCILGVSVTGLEAALSPSLARRVAQRLSLVSTVKVYLITLNKETSASCLSGPSGYGESCILLFQLQEREYHLYFRIPVP